MESIYTGRSESESVTRYRYGSFVLIILIILTLLIVLIVVLSLWLLGRRTELSTLSPLLLASGLFSGAELGFPVLAGLLSGVRQSLFRKRIAHYEKRLTLHCARKTSRSVCQIWIGVSARRASNSSFFSLACCLSFSIWRERAQRCQADEVTISRHRPSLWSSSR